jgi:hypothetical protein
LAPRLYHRLSRATLDEELTTFTQVFVRAKIMAKLRVALGSGGRMHHPTSAGGEHRGHDRAFPPRIYSVIL